jgi:intracellular septation protein
MKQFAELLPVVLFFVVYQLDGRQLELGGWHFQFDGIFTATQVLIAATVAQLALTRIVTGKLEKRQIWLLLAVVLFGSATLIFRNELFIQWKPTIFNWVLAVVFVAAPRFGGKTLMERAMGQQLSLPAFVWQRLNWLWIGNFVVVGALNLLVAYHFSEAFWVSYRLWSAIGFTLLLTALTVGLIMPHLRDRDGDGSGERSS